MHFTDRLDRARSPSPGGLGGNQTVYLDRKENCKMTTLITIINALVSSVPRIIELARQGRDISQIKLGEIISTDALEKLASARESAEDFIKNG